jgi:uncharacterized protein
LGEIRAAAAGVNPCNSREACDYATIWLPWSSLVTQGLEAHAKIGKNPSPAMLFVLSPAKSLDYESPLPAQLKGLAHTLPPFAGQAAELVALLRPLSPRDLGQLMDISDTLAGLNTARFEAWSPKFSAKNSRQSVLAFNGDVYEGLDAKSLPLKDLEWAQAHILSLSGLYGVLRPLDWMQPYRLEMGTRLANARGKDLYAFWGAQIAHYLDQALQKQTKTDPKAEAVIVNLASQEYFKSVQRTALKARVVECVFEEYKNGTYKVISFMAKRARGLMARYAIEHRLTQVSQLKRFDREGYRLAESVSSTDRLVFRRTV